MGAFDNDKKSFRPRNAIFEKLKKNFETDSKKGVYGGRLPDNTKAASFFRQRNGLLKNTNELTNRSVSGVAKRLCAEETSEDKKNRKVQLKDSLTQAKSSSGDSPEKNTNAKLTLYQFTDMLSLDNNQSNKESSLLADDDHKHEIDISSKATTIRSLAGTDRQRPEIKNSIKPIVSLKTIDNNIDDLNTADKENMDFENFCTEKKIKDLFVSSSPQVKESTSYNNEVTNAEPINNNNNNNHSGSFSTLVDSQTNAIVFDAFCNMQGLCTNLKKELILAKQKVSEIGSENVEIKKKEAKAVNLCNVINSKYKTIFTDFRQLRQDLSGKSQEIENLKKDLLNLGKEVTEGHKDIDKLKKTVSELKTLTRKQEIAIIKKDQDLVASREKIKSLELFKNNGEYSLTPFKPNMSLLKDALTQTKDDLLLTIDHQLLEYYNKLSFQLNMGFTKKKIPGLETGLDSTDYDKLGLLVDKIIKRNNDAFFSKSVEEIKNYISTYIESDQLFKDQKYASFFEEMFENLTNTLTQTAENQTDSFDKHLKALDQQIKITVKNTHPTFQIETFLVSNLEKLNALEQEIILQNQLQIKEQKKNFKFLFEVISNFHPTTQANLNKLTELCKNLDELKESNRNMNKEFDKKSIILKNELSGLRNTIKELQNSNKPHVARIASDESNTTAISDLNFTRELSVTNEFEEILTSDPNYQCQAPFFSEAQDTKSFETSEEILEYKMTALKSLETTKVIALESKKNFSLQKKVSFNDSVTILNTGDTVKLFEKEQDDVKSPMVSELPSKKAIKTVSIGPLASIEINKLAAKNKDTPKRKVGRPRQKRKLSLKNSHIPSENESKTSSSENSSIMLESIFETHFKEKVRKPRGRRKKE